MACGAAGKNKPMKKQMLIKLNAGNGLSGAKSVRIERGRAPVQVLNAAFANPAGTKIIVPASDTFYVLNVKKSVGATGS